MLPPELLLARQLTTLCSPNPHKHSGWTELHCRSFGSRPNGLATFLHPVYDKMRDVRFELTTFFSPKEVPYPSQANPTIYNKTPIYFSNNAEIFRGKTFLIRIKEMKSREDKLYLRGGWLIVCWKSGNKCNFIYQHVFNHFLTNWRLLELHQMSHGL